MSDIEVGYREFGEGSRYVVFLHGNGEDSSYFAGQQSLAKSGLHLLMPDTRWHGTTPKGNRNLSYGVFADDLRDFLDTLSVERADIVGFSDGAITAILFARKYPHRVGRLVLNGANLNPFGIELGLYLRMFLKWTGFCLSPWVRDRSRKIALYSLMLFYPHIRPESLYSLSMPVMVIVGNRDMIRRRHSVLIHRSIPQSRMCILEGTHFIASEKPVEFNREMLKFLLD